uniref:NAC domain-containing protein n=1 Tax=Physcomitrium patens TaxID=3218 RepID=A0A2K1ICH3_PHYPA|nr:hypothetical protein PHYPA_030448 [Physcomitrium patens]
MRKTLVFYQGRAPHGIKSDWIVHELRLDAESEPPTHANSCSTFNFCTFLTDGGWVVCRVFKKNKNLKMEMQQERAISYEKQMGALPPEAAGSPTTSSGSDGTELNHEETISGSFHNDSYFENRSLSLPLGSWSSAEDTALRVIKEQADDMCFEDEMLRFGFYGIDHDCDCGGESLNDNMAWLGCFNPKLQSTKSPKWVKVLVSPMTSRNRVFPSRSKDDVRKSRGSRKRAARFASSDWGRKEENDVVSQQEQRTVFSWLQDAGTRSQLRRREQRDQRVSSSSPSR